MYVWRGIVMAVNLLDVPGIGVKTADYLVKQGIGSAEALLAAGLEALIAAPGFGEARARRVLDAAAGLVVEQEEAALPKRGKEKKDGKAKAAKKEKKGKKKEKTKKKEKGDKKKATDKGQGKKGKKKAKGKKKK